MTDDELTAHVMAPEPEGHGMLEWPGGDFGREIHTQKHTPGNGWYNEKQPPGHDHKG